jgi:hypothetical protein
LVNVNVDIRKLLKFKKGVSKEEEEERGEEKMAGVQPAGIDVVSLSSLFHAVVACWHVFLCDVWNKTMALVGVLVSVWTLLSQTMSIVSDLQFCLLLFHYLHNIAGG